MLQPYEQDAIALLRSIFIARAYSMLYALNLLGAEQPVGSHHENEDHDNKRENLIDDRDVGVEVPCGEEFQCADH